MLAGLIGSQPSPDDGLSRTGTVADSYDGFDAKAAEQLRQDQCLMADALRLGGPVMGTLAQTGLNQTPEQLRVTANQEYWNNTPLSAAFQQDRDTVDQDLESLRTRVQAWKTPLDGLPYPGGFKSVSDFFSPPGVSSSSGDDFFRQVGYSTWLGEQYWKNEGLLYEDPTPEADETTVQAVKNLGTPLYSEPDPGLPSKEWAQAYAEWQAFDTLLDGYAFTDMGADDARMFLAAGGFPRTAPEPGSLPFRLAVEDLKTRFAACAWRNPIDPSKVLGQEVATASAEWQREIAAQAAQRNQILTANRDATKALAVGARALGEMLGQSWIADHLTRWKDYWSEGGPGWIGDSPLIIHIHAASDKCLEVAGGSKADGALVQMYTCNGGAHQKWQIDGDALVNVNSGKCLDVKGAGTANGTVIEQWTCKQNGAQQWEYTTHGTTQLKNTGSGKCLDMHTYANSQDAWLWACNGTDPQKFDIVPSGHNGTGDLDYPTVQQFVKATAGIARARTAAQTQLDLIKQQAQIAGTADTSTDQSLNAAYAIADRDGAPRGRALLVGQQKAQVTKASAAALNAMVKAGETAYAATRASAADSATITARAVAQAAGSRAAFRTAAAEAAKKQAKAAADAAAVQADQAKAARDLAKAKLAETQKAEADAKAAAAAARAKRLEAEKEEATAKAEKETAAQKQAEASQHKARAQEHASQAQQAKERAQAADATATEKRKGAEAARDKAKALRDDAWDAEQKANTTRAKADAKEAYAQASESEDNAQEARQAANAADAAADDAEAAAASARAEAGKATQAAADADAAATRAEAAAKRARADADAAQAAKLKADAAVRTATSTAADAIAASKSAAASARAAVELADKAEEQAADAKAQADAAKTEAATALKGANQATGHAYTTAQAAVDAGNAAAQVAAPANDAIQLGSPYITTDSAAGLAVLTGQSSKTIAQQQLAVAEAHAKNAQEEAAQAQSVANAAAGDAKAAYTLAAEAARYAADARASAKKALEYSAQAADYAAQAAQSLGRTIAHGQQAAEDAAAADRAAGRAEGYAADARDSADQAALDAEAAHAAAAEAEQAAKDAREAADHAAAEAAAAEEAAKDAQQYAESAQQAAEEADREQANQQISTGTGTGIGIGNVFYVVDEKKTTFVSAKQIGTCPSNAPLVGCDARYELHVDLVADFYLCTDENALATSQGCPKGAWLWLDETTLKDQTTEWSHHFSGSEIIKIGWQNLFGETLGGILYTLILGDAIECFHGSKTACAWTAVMFIPLSKPLAALSDAIKALDAAARTGIGFEDAWKGLRALKVSDEVIEGIGAKVLGDLVEACTRAVRTLSVSSGGSACEGMIAYGSTELSRMAYQARTAAGISPGRNVAVVRVPGWNDPKTGDLVIGFSKGGGYHSENHILDQLASKGFKPTQITELYSDRTPCAVCSSLLGDALNPGTPISWAVPDGPGSANLLARMIQAFGG
ncbi:RICIN domain-containing protein [Streptomyces leeuwenhoekii]|uniref:RICIN domain-containing protein n=1 Tax=Streptomyces leeuwenhoekii TaxID=1437453 RepID=UPI0036FA0C51